MPTLMERVSYFGFKKPTVLPEHADSFPRFTLLVCSMFCSIVVSSLYAYSLLSSQMSNVYKYSQTDITTVSTVGIVVGYFTFPFGFIYDYCGPKYIFVLGTLLLSIGFIIFGLIFDNHVTHSVMLMSVMNAVITLGSSLFDMGTVLTLLSWFPLDRGPVVACVKTATGLGSSLLSVLYNAYFHNDNSLYMYFLAALSIVIGVISVFLFYLPPYHMTGRRMKQYTAEDHKFAKDFKSVYMQVRAPLKRFVVAYTIIVALIVAVLTSSIIFVFKTNVTASQRVPASIVILILYALFTVVAFPSKWLDTQPAGYDRLNIENVADKDTTTKAERNDKTTHDSSDELAVRDQQPEDEEEDDHDVCVEAELSSLRTRKQIVRALHQIVEEEKLSPQFHTGFFRNVRRPSLFCLWIAGFCVSGATNVITMNVTQIYYAAAESSANTTLPALYVALNSVGSALGRLVMGFLEVYTQSRPAEKRTPITVFYAVPPALCVAACALILFIPPSGLLLPVLLGGGALGFYAAAEVLVVRAIFSVDVAKHYNSLFFFEMLAVIFMNSLLFGTLMTKNSKTVNGNTACLNRQNCLRTSFLVLLVLSAIGFVGTVWLNVSYISFARQEYARRRERRLALQDMLREYDEKNSQEYQITA